MQVKVKKRTYANEYGILSIGDILEVDEKTAERWAQKNIAEVLENGRKAEQGNTERQETEEKPLSEKTRVELMAIALEKGLQFDGYVKKAELIERIEKDA